MWMSKRLPNFSSKHKICVVCEGEEEYAYLSKLISLNVWSTQYELTLDNACGNGNIPARYQDRYQNGSFELVLVFCDTEKKPYDQFLGIKEKIDKFHGVMGASDRVVIYGQPCTMQIILKHWSDIVLKSPS